MASTANDGKAFEAPHNIVHNAIGAVMLNLGYSAFDPIL